MHVDTYIVERKKPPFHRFGLGGASKRRQEHPLPIPFELPRKFQAKVHVGLGNGNLTGCARAKLITSIAEAIYI